MTEFHGKTIKHVAVAAAAGAAPGGTKPATTFPLTTYKELFRVVFQIPDECVKNRVLSAILAALNGDSPVSKCNHCSVKLIDGSTQTTASVDVSQKSQIHSRGDTVKLGRRRKVLTPRAGAASDLGVSLTKRQQLLRANEDQERAATRPPRERKSDLEGLGEFIVEGIEEHPDLGTMLRDLDEVSRISDEAVKKMMVKDWVECVKYINGYLPIHWAAKDSKEIILKRQCITLNFRNIGVDLETDDGLTALQIAILSQADSQIILLLLEHGANVAKVDAEGNNCALLAAKYIQDVRVFAAILRKTSLCELQRLNFSSYGIFRVVVDTGKLNFLHELLKYVDESLGEKTIMPELTTEEEFIVACREKLAKIAEEDVVKLANSLKINDLKAKMINQRDNMAKKTPLFCAVEKQKESLMLALLVNFADPRVQTSIGMDSYMVANELQLNKKFCVPLQAIQVIFDNILSCNKEDATEKIVKSKKNIRKKSLETEDTTGMKRRKLLTDLITE